MPPKKSNLTKTQKKAKLKLKKEATAALKLKEQQELIEDLKKTKLELKAQTSLNKTLKEQVEDLELDKEETEEDLTKIMGCLDAIMLRGWTLQTPTSGPLEWRESERNKEADLLANICMDTKQDVEEWQEQKWAALSTTSNIHIFIDGV